MQCAGECRWQEGDRDKTGELKPGGRRGTTRVDEEGDEEVDEEGDEKRDKTGELKRKREEVDHQG